MMMVAADPVAEDVPVEAAGGEPVSPSWPTRVLVVEDEDSARGALLKIFRHFACDVRGAATLREAMAQLDWAECVVLDLMLPDGNGIEVLRHVRAARLPLRVAVTTGVYDWHLLEDVHRLGPEALYHKPVEASKLVEWLCGG